MKQIEKGLTNPQAMGAIGFDIIAGIFDAINTVMGDVAQNFYKSIISNPAYFHSINGLVTLYIAIYGIMIMFGLASFRPAEVISRLLKIGLLWSMMGPGGWNFFSQYVELPIMVAMNQLIGFFSLQGNSLASGGSVVNPVIAGSLSTASVGVLMAPMSLMFSMTLIIIVVATFSTGTWGWFFAIIIIWALIEFITVVVGALITYIKAVVGLAFLLGLAPVFFAFILFEKSKQIFMGWVSLVFGFFLQPVLLFAFLGFYALLLNGVLLEIIYPPSGNPATSAVDYCWVKFYTLGPLNLYWWRAIDVNNGATGFNGNATCSSGTASDCYVNDWQGPPPIDIMTILYFILLTHLGKSLSKFIEQIANDISGGQGPGIVRGNAVGKWFSNTFTGGRGPGRIARDIGIGLGSGAAMALAGTRAKTAASISANNSGSKGGGDSPGAGFRDAAGGSDAGGGGTGSGAATGTGRTVSVSNATSAGKLNAIINRADQSNPNIATAKRVINDATSDDPKKAAAAKRIINTALASSTRLDSNGVVNFIARRASMSDKNEDPNVT